MKCPACSTEVPAESSFCPKCGARTAQQIADESVTPTDKLKATLQSKQELAPEDETQLWVGGYSAKAMLGTWLLGGLISLGLIVGMVFFPTPPTIMVLGAILVVLWIALFCMLAYKKLGVSYELTTQRFIHKSGILKRVTDRIEVIDIDDVTYEQGLVQRALNVGKIRVSSTDRTHPELVLDGISDVKRVADMIDDIRRKERRKRGVHIESI